jgi:hypothetical protein
VVDHVVGTFQHEGWDVAAEFTFSVYGERGSIDVCAWHASSRSLAVVEVKPLIDDLQDLLATLDRKVRLIPQLVKDRGWRPVSVSRLVVVFESSANRGTIRRHDSVFRASLPDRTIAVRRWLHGPIAPINGIWMVPATRTRVGMRAVRGRTRVRHVGRGRRGPDGRAAA